MATPNTVKNCVAPDLRATPENAKLHMSAFDEALKRHLVTKEQHSEFKALVDSGKQYDVRVAIYQNIQSMFKYQADGRERPVFTLLLEATGQRNPVDDLAKMGRGLNVFLNRPEEFEHHNSYKPACDLPTLDLGRAKAVNPEDTLVLRSQQLQLLHRAIDLKVILPEHQKQILKTFIDGSDSVARTKLIERIGKAVNILENISEEANKLSKPNRGDFQDYFNDLQIILKSEKSIPERLKMIERLSGFRSLY